MTNTKLPVPATTREIKLHEVVLIVLNRATGDAHLDGISAESLTLLLMHEPLAQGLACGLNSIYASMSGMRTHGRIWIEPARYSPKKGGLKPVVGRNAPYRITETGRARVATILKELEEVAATKAGVS